MSQFNKRTSRTKRKGKKVDDGPRQLEFKDDGQEYAKVTALLGNRRVKAFCFDGIERICTIRGAMHKKVWVQLDDIILVGLREFQSDKADVIHKFTAEEARQLVAYNEIQDPSVANKAEGGGGDGDETVEFRDGDGLDIDSI